MVLYYFLLQLCDESIAFLPTPVLGRDVDKRRDIISSGDCTFIKKTQKNNLMSESYYLHFLWWPTPHSYCRRDHISSVAVTQALARCPRWVNFLLELAFHISRILFFDARYPICGHLLIQTAFWSESLSVRLFLGEIGSCFFYVPGFTLSPQQSPRHS